MQNTCCLEVDPQETGFELEVSSQAQLYLLPSWKTGRFIGLFEFRNAKATKHTIYHLCEGQCPNDDFSISC